MKNKDTKDLVMKDFEAYPDVAADLLSKAGKSSGGTDRNVVSGTGKAEKSVGGCR